VSEDVLDCDHRDDDATRPHWQKQLGIFEQRNFDVKYLVCRHQEGRAGLYA
jgi:hypothetical protein